MLTVLLAVAVGGAIGYFKIIPQRFSFLTNYLTWIGLSFLLLTMGIKIGSDKKILANLGQLGLTAFILALFAVVFSVMVIFMMEKYYLKSLQNKGGEEL